MLSIREKIGVSLMPLDQKPPMQEATDNKNKKRYNNYNMHKKLSGDIYCISITIIMIYKCQKT